MSYRTTRGDRCPIEQPGVIGAQLDNTLRPSSIGPEQPSFLTDCREFSFILAHISRQLSDRTVDQMQLALATERNAIDPGIKEIGGPITNRTRKDESAAQPTSKRLVLCNDGYWFHVKRRRPVPESPPTTVSESRPRSCLPIHYPARSIVFHVKPLQQAADSSSPIGRNRI